VSRVAGLKRTTGRLRCDCCLNTAIQAIFREELLTDCSSRRCTRDLQDNEGVALRACAVWIACEAQSGTAFNFSK